MFSLCYFQGYLLYYVYRLRVYSTFSPCFKIFYSLFMCVLACMAHTCKSEDKFQEVVSSTTVSWGLNRLSSGLVANPIPLSHLFCPSPTFIPHCHLLPFFFSHGKRKRSKVTAGRDHFPSSV